MPEIGVVVLADNPGVDQAAVSAPVSLDLIVVLEEHPGIAVQPEVPGYFRAQ